MSTTPDRFASQEVWHRPFVKEHREWCDAFVIELRLRDVPGPVIGDRLAEVEAHCTETGEAPAEAFGDATQYAVLLDEPSSPQGEAGVWRVAVIAAAQVLALLVGVAAAAPWARGEVLAYNIVQLGALAIFVVVILALPVLLRPMLERPWTTFPVVGIGLLAGIGSAAAGSLDLPAVLSLPPAAISVAAFVVVLVLAWAQFRELSRDAGGELVTSPLAPMPQAPRARTDRRWATLLPVFLIPLGYVALSAFGWLAA